MHPVDVVPYIVKQEGVSTIGVSRAMGRSDGYIASYIANKRTPNIALMAEIGDVVGYDLLLRRRADSTEIPIDPPKS